MEKENFCSAVVLLNTLIYGAVFYALKMGIGYCIFFVCSKEINRCRSPPSVNLNLKNFKLIGGKNNGKNA